MNFFDAELIREGDKYSVELDGWRIPLSEKKRARLLEKDVPSRPVTLGVRPEHTLLWQEGGVLARVDVSEMMGSSVHLHVNAAGKDAIIVVPILDAEESYEPGDTVRFRFAGSSAHVFDPETGKNLEW